MKNQLKTMAMQILLMGPIAGFAASPAEKTGDVPASLQVAANEVLTQKLHAVGVQIYTCLAGKDEPTHYEWVLKAPEADLSDRGGNQIAKHYAGPTWEARDGSKVTGEVKARADSPDGKGVAWLLLSAKSTSGSGIFAAVRYIQRLHTVGGNAPTGGCGQASAGSEVRVPYSAEYRFYTGKQ
jgi:Protein of unknown function (DUF3455)